MEEIIYTKVYDTLSNVQLVFVKFRALFITFEHNRAISLYPLQKIVFVQ